MLVGGTLTQQELHGAVFGQGVDVESSKPQIPAARGDQHARLSVSGKQVIAYARPVHIVEDHQVRCTGLQRDTHCLRPIGDGYRFGQIEPPPGVDVGI